MGGDALRDVNTEGCDLLLRDGSAGQGPDAGTAADALGEHTEVAAGANENFFEEPDEIHWAEVWAAFARQVSAQIKDGVANELTGAVISNVAAAVGLVDLNIMAAEVVL
ncbi:MAG: hypothetical protein NVSMB3_00300 [Acidobacteriaceae bacterium]